jgi:hypothetical protein
MTPKIERRHAQTAIAEEPPHMLVPATVVAQAMHEQHRDGSIINRPPPNCKCRTVACRSLLHHSSMNQVTFS